MKIVSEVLLVIMLMLANILSTAFGQSSQYVLTSSLSVGYTLHDFSTVRHLKESIPIALRQKQVARLDQMFSGINVSYRRDLNNRFAINTKVGGTFINEPSGSPTLSKSTKVFAELNPSVEFRPLNGRFWIEPHLDLGVTLTYYPTKSSMLGVAGFGLTIPFNQDIYADVSTSYRLGLTKINGDHLYFNVAIGGILSKKLKRSLPKVIPSSLLNYDKDFDGTPDSIDVCPVTPGLIMFYGCPDTDSDSIPDQNDRCPFQKGLVELLGCPQMDSDHDGITDDVDSCILTPGSHVYKGCPIPDSDSDGLNDEVDSCISLPGPLTNNGCPIATNAFQTKLSELAKLINFSSGEYLLSNEAIETLEHVAQMLHSKSFVKIIIKAHTDDIGSIESNLQLSNKRAQSIRTYLLSKGISSDRMSSIGYGESKPRGSNETERGRSHNRRVEILVGNVTATILEK